jgi:hypothetical protein
MNQFLLGVVAMASLVAGLFFLRFWRETRDRLFLAFAASFFVEGTNRSLLAFSGSPHEGSAVFYMVRLLSFLIILIAIVDKNRSESRATPPSKGDQPSVPSAAPARD